MTDFKSNSLERMLSLLDVFTEARPIWMTEDLIEQTGSSRSTCYRYISILHKAGLLASVGNGSYVLGPRILELDLQIRQCDPIYRFAGPVLKRLAADTQWSSLLCVLYSHSVMCVRSEGGGAVPGGFFTRGQKRSLFRGAASKVILANLPPHQIKKLFTAHGRVIARTGLGRDLDSFKASLRQIRDNGFCQTVSEFSPGVTGIACPIFNRDAKILGSIGIGARTTSANKRVSAGLIEHVRQAAAEANAMMSTIDTALDQPARAVG